MDDMSTRYNQIRDTSYSGEFIWKIEHFSCRRKDAIEGHKTFFCSPSFYLGPHGYHLCARVFLNGDGRAKNSHISIFITIKKGKFDDILKWPFSQVVTFTLLDAKDNKKNITDSFLPSGNLSCFDKPSGEPNTSAGIPLFAPIGILDTDIFRYVANDSMFIKIHINTNGLYWM